jgi:hypothetical protein
LAGLEREKANRDEPQATVAEVVEMVLYSHYAWRRAGPHCWSAPVVFALGIFLRLDELPPDVLPPAPGLGFGLAI